MQYVKAFINEYAALWQFDGLKNVWVPSWQLESTKFPDEPVLKTGLKPWKMNG